jgi:hypothetical protein
MWRQSIETHQPMEVGPMVWPPLLDPDSLDRMLVAWRALPFHDGIGNAMSFLAGVFDGGFLEEKLTASFTALEALVNAIGAARRTDTLLQGAARKSFDKGIRASIKALGDKLSLSEAQRTELRESLAGLTRRPIARRVAELIQETGVDLIDLWPHDTDVLTALKVAFTERNGVIHQGRLADIEFAYDTYLRVHAITERLIYHFLEGDERWRRRGVERHLERLFYSPATPAAVGPNTE